MENESQPLPKPRKLGMKDFVLAALGCLIISILLLPAFAAYLALCWKAITWGFGLNLQ